MNVLLVAPPRLLWPYMNEQDNFMMPQSLPCLAAVLRAAGMQVSVIDCLPQKVGWATLERRIRELAPDVVAAGENHALYAGEVLKLVELVKRIDPRIVTVLGGAHFTNLPDRYLRSHPIDFIVRGEGEITFRELLKALDAGTPTGDIEGIAYYSGGAVVQTPPRPLIADLDSLPLPAFDLMPMDRYGRAKLLFNSGGVTIHHSRGCGARCSFCVWWTQMGERKITAGQETLTPRWRTKSVERTLAEIEVLHKQYGRRGLVFVDPTFNLDSEWNDEFAEALLKKGWPIHWFAFMRADLVLRDERLGIFDKLVRSGLAHLCIGVERAEDADLKDWSKKFYSKNQSVETFRLLKTKYPQVFRQATFILGTRNETPETIERQLDFARLIDADYPAFHAATPFPGTDFWREANDKKWIEVEDFDYFDMSTPVMGSETMTREELGLAIIELSRRYVGVRWLLKGLASRTPYRRNMYLWWLLVSGRIFIDSARHFINPFSQEQYTRLVKPDWYDH